MRHTCIKQGDDGWGLSQGKPPRQVQRHLMPTF
jgi:hypothetical protein